jgi:hypothetical protein
VGYRPTNDQIMADHACTCPTCTPAVAVSSARQGPQHIGVRFWDDNPEEGIHQRYAMLLLDGVEVAGVFEAVLGEQGKVWRYRGVPSASDMGRHLCLTCRRRESATIAMDDSTYPPDGIPTARLCQEMLHGAVALTARPRTL